MRYQISLISACAALLSSQASAIGAPAGTPYNPYKVKMLGADQSLMINNIGKRSKVKRLKTVSHKFIDRKRKRNAPKPSYSFRSPGLSKAKPDAEGKLSIVVRFKQDYSIPFFPAGASQRRTIASRLDKKVRSSKSRIKGLAVLRKHGFDLDESFWIANAVAGKIPYGRLGALLKVAPYAGITYIQEENTSYIAPQDGNANNDVARVRAGMSTDPYRGFSYDGGNASGRISLFDSGIQASHDLLSGRISVNADCVEGGSSCLGAGRRLGDVEPNGHGTSSASIMVGTNALGNRFRGVTNSQVNSYIIYNDPNPSATNPKCRTRACGNTTAALRAFQEGMKTSSKVLVAEMQWGGTEADSVAIAADNAFDAGFVVIGANGNNGPNAGTVNNPGRAHKALGVGAIYLRNPPSQYANQSRGPATDGRFKPDIQAYSLSETGRKGANDRLGTFGGTSGSTPYAGAAADRMAAWLNGYGIVNPAFTYAFLLNSGENFNFISNNERTTEGVGLIRLPTDGSATCARLTIKNKQSKSIPINVPSGASTLRAAVWWPESLNQTHNDLDIRLINPSGQVVAGAFSISSVWEATAVNNPTPGTWQVKVNGYKVSGNGQEAFLAVTRLN